jgi:hypothetical protein
MRLYHLFTKGLLLAVVVLAYTNCGLDDYIALNQVDRSNINVELGNSFVRIGLPSQPLLNYFRNYEIYYRIYASGTPLLGSIPESSLSVINSFLYSHYTTILPYTNPDNNTNISGSLFPGLGYHVLNNSLPESGIIRIDFAETGTITEPSINGTPLLRSSAFSSVLPTNRFFLNDPELYNPGNNNLDVQASSSSSTGYTYVCMYIIATGVDNNYSQIYSKPTFIGVFSLPDR